MLLLDGHSSHYEPRSVEIAKEEEIILFCLPPHTTQDSQPLDCTVFGPLKRHWWEICHQHQQHNPGVVISKLNFSGLFSQAWLNALTPGNIVAGFRKCGIHPFNQQAIPLAHEAATVSTEPSTTNDPLTTEEDGSITNTEPENTASKVTFTPEQIDLFNTRFTEGYDIYDDQQYVTWLQLAHPEAVPNSITTPSPEGPSVLGEFSNVSLIDPLPVDDPADDPSTDTVTPAPAQSTPHSTGSSNNLISEDSLTTANSTSSKSSNPQFSSATPSHQIGGRERQTSASPVDKHLQLPTAPKKKGTVASSSTRAMTGARVLTSAECLAIIKEKEQKKKQQEEEKENRKRLREDKKKQQEEEKQKKAEQRMLKEREREKQREKKAEERHERQKSEQGSQELVPLRKQRQQCTPPDPKILNQFSPSGFFMNIQICLKPSNPEETPRTQIPVSVVFVYNRLKRTWNWALVLNGSSVPVNAGFMKTV